MPTAKHPDVRRRANRRATAADLAVPDEPQGPELPESYVLGAGPHGVQDREYSDTTRRWWDALRRSPHATAFESHHWPWLLALAALYDRWAALGDLDAFKELRLQAKAFGLRPTDANALDWRINPSVTGPTSTRERPPEPPRGGPGSGEDVWRHYATEVLELRVPEAATRQDIISLVDAHSKGRPSRQDPRLTVFDGEGA